MEGVESHMEAIHKVHCSIEWKTECHSTSHTFKGRAPHLHLSMCIPPGAGKNWCRH